MASKNPRPDLTESGARLAVLIDADNAQAAVVENALAEIARFGEATVKRISGDFTANESASWKKALQRFAIKPVQRLPKFIGRRQPVENQLPSEFAIVDGLRR